MRYDRRMSSKAAQNLVAALETIKQIFDASSVDVAAAREGAERARQAFESKLSAKIAGEPSTPLDLAAFSSGSLERTKGQMSNERERATAFLDAFQALFPLYADPATREISERVFGLLRQMKEIDSGIGTEPFEFPMPNFDANPKLIAPNPGRLDAFMKFHDAMHERMDKRQVEGDRQIARSRELLGQALEAARKLLAD